MTDKEAVDKVIAKTLEKVTKIEVEDSPSPKTYQYLICMRVEDLPIPGTKAGIENCPKCSRRIWVSVKSPKGVERICYHCMLPVIANEQEIVLGMSTKTLQRLRALP